MGATDPFAFWQQQMMGGINAAGQKAQQFGQWAGDTLWGKQIQAPERYQFDWANADQTRGNEMALLKQYQDMAAGTGPSLAQGQLQQATDRNLAQAMALGAAQQGQGLGYASALRNIADQSAAARQQAAAQAAMIRNAEQMQGMQGTGALLGQIGGQDFQRQGMGQTNAYNYDALNSQIAAQNRQPGGLGGSLLNAAGAIFQPGGPLTGLFKQQPAAQPPPPDPLPLSSGGQVPGYAMGGQMDSRRNDTVPAMLSPGEIVLPRSITMAPNAAERSKAFVEAVLARREKGPPQSDEHELVRQSRMRKAA